MDAAKETLTAGYNTAKRALSSAPPNDAYLRWDAPGVEAAVPDEEAKANQIADTMLKMQKHNFDKHRHAFRSTHVKTQGLVKGTLIIPSLPPHLAQGLFATPGTHPVAARYANEPVFLQDDKEPGPRGMALKVFNVSGPRLLDLPDNKNLTTQDFFFNNAPMIELTDIDTCLSIMQLREKYFDSPTQLSLALKTRSDIIKQHAPSMLPNTNIISHSMFTQSAFRFGDYYGHMALFPVLESMTSALKDAISSTSPPSQLSDWLFDYFHGSPAKYEFKIQLGTSPEHHPTEDASVVWDEVTSPYQTIGTVEFPVQDAFLRERRVFWEDRMALDPWRGLEAHRPLGSINRLRKVVYGRSKKGRDGFNAVVSGNVQSIDEMP